MDARIKSGRGRAVGSGRVGGELQLGEAGIDAAFAEQALMRALFHQPPLIEHEDAVGARHRGETVGDDQRGAPLMFASSARCTRVSLSESSALVASSSNRIGASRNTARAMAMRWRWPAESVTPPPPAWCRSLAAGPR